MPVMGGKGTAAAKVGNDKKKATAAKEKKAQGWSETLSDEPKKNDDDSSKKKKPALVRAKTQSLKFLRVRRKPWYSHERVREAYMNPWVQWFIASLIMGNFISNCVEKQIDPWGIEYPIEWMWIEFAWNSAFVIELLWNMWGSFYICQWKDHFLRSGWNLFDMFVVAVSIPSMLPAIGVSTSIVSPGATNNSMTATSLKLPRSGTRISIWGTVQPQAFRGLGLSGSIPSVLSTPSR